MESAPPAVLNNSAIACWHAWQIQDATQLFKSALAKLHSSLDGHDANQQGEGLSKSIAPIDDQSASTASVRSVHVVNSASVQQHALMEDTSNLICFTQAFQVDCSNPMTDNDVLTAVVLFNFALLSHMHGMTCGKVGYMDWAYKMYCLALRLLVRKSGNALLQLALCNNMAHIDECRFRRDDMMASVTHMKSIISGNENKSEINSIDEDICMTFCTNIVCAGSSLLGAPAA